MERLPVQAGNWDQLLHFLGVAHRANGALDALTNTGSSGNSGLSVLSVSGGNTPGTALTDQALFSSWLVQSGAGATGYSPWQLTQTSTKTDGLATDTIGGFTVINVSGGGGVAVVGTDHCITANQHVRGQASDSSEHAVYVGNHQVEIGTGFTQASGPSGRHWFSDWAMHGPVAVQPNLLNGTTMLINNYYNGSPLSSDAAGMWVTTKAGTNGSATHNAATTYTVNRGIGVCGIASASAAGFTSAIKLGGTGTGWDAASRFTNAVEIADYDTYGIKITGVYSGATPTAAISVASGTGPVIIGGTAALGGSSTLLEVQSNGTLDPMVQFGRVAASDSFSIALRNSAGTGKLALAGGTNAFVTGVAAGDMVLFASSSKKVHLGGATVVVSVTNDSKLGFFNVATPVLQQATTGTATGFTAGGGTTVTDASTFTGASGSTAYRISDLVLALKNYGLLAA